MKRRNFLKVNTISGIGLTTVPFNSFTFGYQDGLSFLAEKGNPGMLYPRPLDGIELEISPPGLAWYPAEGAFRYRIEIQDLKGIVYQKDIGKETVHLPHKILEPGKYSWDVYALDENGVVKASRGKQTFSISENPEKLPWIDPAELISKVSKEHSRVVFLKANMPIYKNRLDTTHKNVWKYIKQRADSYLNIGIPPFPEYHKTPDRVQSRMEYQQYFHLFRQYVDNAMNYLSQAWLFGHEKKYADAAKAILLEISDWPTDYDDVSSVGARWGDEPGLSFSRYAHKAYDWLYDALSGSEKEKVFKMCEARAWQTLKRLEKVNYLTNSGESHNGRLISYLTEMAVAMAHESEGAETWLDYSLKALTTIYPHWGGIEGGWAEGIPYGLWYNNFYIPVFDSLLENTGYNLWKRPFFSKIRYFYMYCSSPLGEIRPFGDSAEKGGPGTTEGRSFANLIHYHALRYNDPYAAWWVEQIPVWDGSTDAQSVLFDNSLKPEKPLQLPNSRVFNGVGWAGIHSNLSDPENDTFLLFKSSPYGSVSHSHGDQNSFAIMKGGVALAIPSGHYGPRYGMPHHAGWTRSTKANNSILVNGKGQVLRSDKASGKIVDFEDKKGYTYVLGDATKAYGGLFIKFVRHILFLRPGFILMLDELETKQESNFQWMLHALEEMNLDKNKIVSQRKNARLSVWIRSTQELAISQNDQFDPTFNEGSPKEFHKEMPNHWHVQAETQGKSKKCRIATIMAVDTLERPLKMSFRDHKGWFGASVKTEIGDIEGWIQQETQTSVPPGYKNKSSVFCAKDAAKTVIQI